MLRSGYFQHLMSSVAMTSNVKSGEQIFLSLHDVFLPSCIGRAGASNMRRLILLLSVGGVPPYLRPSGPCLCLGTRMPAGLVTLSRVTPHRGCVSSKARGKPRN